MTGSPLTIAACSILLLACNQQEKKTVTTTQETKPVTKPSEPIKECYSKISGKDTVQLSYTINDNVVAGELMYNYFEKDKNTGTIKGKFSGDTLVAEYSYRAEGMLSVREVAFVKKGNLLVEGFGESKDKADKTVFKSITTLQFDEKAALTKINCN
ncbi:hypothetical protein [Ferruginibacter sp. HRS2-29]|uniref:hypothetical protein n=1 Tax=Ferruginibacter sp. HRS2-29 TaxID=2487334 RepID=UPI0020CE7DF4|nr:hypothetical protein [Ferruginibacter sp. HRS2-29]MCP9749369.1 hypothetical protein [Ferruginibacter sp. HRS2-29]